MENSNVKTLYDEITRIISENRKKDRSINK